MPTNVILNSFSDIVGFTQICSRIKPHEVVMFLNNLYTLFDFLVDQNQVYKVETIGDAYLIVAGCPVKATNHALKICDMAFDMMDGISMLKDPGTGKDVQMRIGCHSGPVVAGIVGLKMPRYNQCQSYADTNIIVYLYIFWLFISDIVCLA